MFLYIVFVTLETGLIALILDRKIFPFLHVPEPMIVVGKTVTVDAEIVRNQELPGKQDQSDQCNCAPHLLLQADTRLPRRRRHPSLARTFILTYLFDTLHDNLKIR